MAEPKFDGYLILVYDRQTRKELTYGPYATVDDATAPAERLRHSLAPQNAASPLPGQRFSVDVVGISRWTA